MTTLNIGLSSNPYKVVEIISILNRFISGKPTNFGIDDGIYNGAIEPTLIVEYKEHNLDITIIQALCEKFKQNCIAAKIAGKGVLIYTPEYQGVWQKFDNEIFITL